MNQDIIKGRIEIKSHQEKLAIDHKENTTAENSDVISFMNDGSIIIRAKKITLSGLQDQL